MDNILDTYLAGEAAFVASVIESDCRERARTQLVQDAEEARLRRQIAEDNARAALLEMTMDELERFRVWLRERGNGWSVSDE